MKSLNQYLMESTQSYDYRIKIAGDLSEEQVTSFEKAFSAFDLVNLTGPKRTPVTKSPAGFTDVENEHVNIIDVTFKYPASTEQFVQIATNMGISANKVIVVNKAFDDSMDQEEANKERSGEDGLLGTEYPGNSTEQTTASDEYGDSYQDSDVIKNAAKSEYEIAGGTPSQAQTTNGLPQGTESPFTKANQK